MNILYLVEFSKTDILVAILYGLLSLIIGILIGYVMNSKYKKQIVAFEEENVKLTSSVSNLEAQYEEEKKAKTNADDEIVLLRNRVRDRDIRIRETEGKMALISKRLEENQASISTLKAEHELNLVELEKVKAENAKKATVKSVDKTVKPLSEIKNIEEKSDSTKEKKSKKSKKSDSQSSSKGKKSSKGTSSSEGKKRGRPAGSKNKSTAVSSSTIELKSSDKKKPGRPAGSKNKKSSPSKPKDIKKASTKSIKKVESIVAEPKRRGRPAGSKNKATSKVEVPTVKRKRGRPAGSTSKTTASSTATKEVTKKVSDTAKKVSPSTTRRRGRPAGSKNKIAASSTGTRGRKKDNLTLIEGIGPKMEEALRNAGIRTFAKIASTKPEKLKSVLVKANSRFGIAATDSWPTQAKFAVKGAFDELKAYQDTLNRGR